MDGVYGRAMALAPKEKRRLPQIHALDGGGRLHHLRQAYVDDADVEQYHVYSAPGVREDFC